MKNFLYSRTFLSILAALLVLTFFLPDIIGPVPAIIIGGLVIAFALYIYNLWCRVPEQDKDHESGPDLPEE